jgi:TetR/AcrR family transcriptional repressor of nem operon
MSTSLQENSSRALILATGQQIMSRKGFSAVGLAEILKEAGVPKGSFYHYFPSKDAFGEAMLADYFAQYHADMDALFAAPGLNGGGRLLAYFADWHENQGASACQGRCLAVKLGAEVADLSEPMRLTLKAGTAGIIDRLRRALDAGVADRSVTPAAPPAALAETLYHFWLGASLMAKIVRTTSPFETALRSTRQMLGL